MECSSDEEDVPILGLKTTRPKANPKAPPKPVEKPPEKRVAVESSPSAKETPKKKPRKSTAKAKPLSRKRCRNEGSDEDDSQDSELEEEKLGAERLFKEGQKALCPPMGDSQRAFYESLLADNNRSIIATKWCVEHGVLMGSQLKDALKNYENLRQAGAFRQGYLGGIKTEFASVFGK